MSWRIPLARPQLDDVDRDAVLSVLRTPTLSLGPEQARFEAEFEAHLDGAHAIAVSNGTAALYLALQALGVDGGEVLTPSYGFIGTIHAIRLAGATPRFVEVDPQTLCVNADTLQEGWTPNCRAVLPVHIFGTPAPMASIVDWAREKSLPVIEDAAEAVGGQVDGRPAGTWGDAGVFAFYPNKQMTTGEGGLVITRDRACAELLRSLRNQGRGHEEFEFVSPGFNFRLDEMSAALGRSQLARLPGFLAARDARAEAYRDRLAGTPGLALLPPVPAPDRRSWFVFPVFVERPEWRAPIRERLHAAGIQTAPYFPAIHRMSVYSDVGFRGAPLSLTESVADRSFAIPFHAGLSREEIAEVSAALLEALDRVAAPSDRHDFSLQTLAELSRT